MSISEQLSKRLEESAARTAGELPKGARAKPRRIIAGLHAQLDILRSSYKRLVLSGEPVSTAGEWLFDNYYILEREGRIVIRALSGLRDIPCQTGENAGVPSAYALARNLCETAAGCLDAEAIEIYIAAAQKVRPFESAELTSLCNLLRAALIEGAALACDGGMEESRRELLLSDAVKTLNFFTTFDFSEIIERQSLLEQILARDPSGCYPKMDDRSRAVYRQRLSEIARRRKMEESEAAEYAIRLAGQGKTERDRHVGRYILERELDRPRPDGRGKLYLCLLFAVPALLSLAAGLLLGRWWLPLALFLPLWEAAKPVTEYFCMKNVPPTFLPRLELEGSIPEEGATLVVVSTLLSSPQKIDGFVKRLEQFYHSNGHGSICFGVLADLKESNLPELPEDKAVRAAAVKAVRALNRRCGPHFYLFIRSRRLSETQGKFSGWERKRGALIELTRLLRGRQTSITTVEGDPSFLPKVKYVITLDADTILLMDTACEMVSAAMHPLNRPVVDEERGVVVQGHGILSPRMGVELSAAGRTGFSRVMAGAGGVTAYDNAAGNTYQDLFGEGIFAGKGLIDVEAFSRLLDETLPENRVLSHDILEGCFLRAAFLSDVELTDGFPASPGPWYDRLHRWIRGDWQNLGYCLAHVRTQKGKVKNPFGPLSRFKLFDNLRRSLIAPAAFACLLAACFCPLAVSLTLIAAAVLSLAGAGLWSALLAVVHGGPSMLSRKYHCKVMPQTLDSIAQAVLAYLFLPYEAYLSLDAVVRALWRQATGKKLLEWTTAAETETRTGSAGRGLRRFWGTALPGLLFLLLSPSHAARIAGAFWIAAPLVAYLSGREVQDTGDMLPEEDLEKLRSYAAAMWQYYDEYAVEADNFLPPDNVQDAPIHVVAHRTSPTNIGLLLLSILSARDMGLIDTEALFERVSRVLATVCKLEKWQGHLLNWYDTRTLRPLTPRYVSTVDSGNLTCCLIALREGLAEYAPGVPGARELLGQIQDLIDGTDLSVLYNKKRRLFHIGYDIEKDCLTGIYYDLLMSEARMTSYCAIAQRVAPKRHWGALGRTLARQNGYAGPISWTGTMFEYMMPHLLLPVYEGSMSAEALRFALYCQKQRVRDKGIPWGISESGFFAFDAALNYQYKAHGVQKLALKRGMDQELIIAPYATFLALPFDPRAGMKNLALLEKMGMYGRCGFFEAADFTFRRTDGKIAVIKSYMAHHVGMSIVACVNLLYDGVMQERFLRDTGMRAAKELLEEKIPSGAVVFRDVLHREIPEKPGRMQLTREEFDEISPVTPRVHAVSNGEYTLILTDTGTSVSMFRGVDLTRRSSDLLGNPQGVFAVASFGETVLPVTRAPEFSGEKLARYRAEFHSDSVLFHAKFSNFEASMQAALHGRLPCEARRVELCNYGTKRSPAELLLYFEPVLAKNGDEAAHPAFSRLFLSVQYRQTENILLFARRPRGGGGELPVFLAVGFAEADARFEFETSRTDLLLRPGGVTALSTAARAPMSGKTGAVPDAACALRVKTELGPRSKKSFTLLLAAAGSADEAALRLMEVRHQGFVSLLRSAAGKDSGGMETRLAALILPQLLFPVGDGRNTQELAGKNRLGQQGLWSLGISGDYPIVLFDYQKAADGENLVPYLKTHKDLRLKGIQSDLAIVYREGGDYSQALLGGINEAVRAAGCEYLVGARAGVHPVNLTRHPPEIGALLAAAACHSAAWGIFKRPQTRPFARRRFEPAPPPPAEESNASAPKIAPFAGQFREDDFVVPHEGPGPFAPWCHILATPAFGTILSDRALGYTWAVNARENKLTPWNNDPVADNRGEMLILNCGTRYFDLTAGARATFGEGFARYESKIGGLSADVRVFLPEKMTVKVAELTLRNDSGRVMEVEAAYYTEPVLGVTPQTRRLIAAKETGSAVFLRNPWAPVSGASFLSAVGQKTEFIFSRAAFLSGRWHQAGLIPPDLCAAAGVKKKLPPGGRERIVFVLGWAAREEAGQALLDRVAALLRRNELSPGRPYSADFVTVHTPDPALDALASFWLRRQFLLSRIMGRTGFYQCGGAWGFRDQLQDCCAALLLDPQIAKRHIYRAAAHQFQQGDVMHWWHQLPPRDGGARGVRTRCSDDLLWLPYTVCEYLEKTGDRDVLGREIYYLDAPELQPMEEDRYFIPARSGIRENVYQHCLRAIECAKKYGAHEIPLFGNGDWNDGMNLVGAGGKGESVWLGMFLSLVLDRFAPVCALMGDESRAEKYREEARRLRETLDDRCWDGQWYLRGFYDDGAPLGGHECEECRIDLLPQSFAALLGLDPEKRRQGLDSALKLLVDRRLSIVRLFDPPFDHGSRNPGYIKAYPPGIRENGGQYTHGAVWLALALLLEGRADEGYEILSLLSPARKGLSEEDSRRYRLEPYAMAADIYSNPSCEGRGGWSLYTGSAAWYYRALLEVLLGIRIRETGIALAPRLPSGWNGFTAELRLRGTEISLTVQNGGACLLVDGRQAECIPLDGKKHTALLSREPGPQGGERAQGGPA